MSDRSGHTQTLSDVLETIQNFSDSISSTIDAWEAFRKTQLHFFVPEGHSNDKPAYSRLLGSTIQNMGELERLRSLLLTQRAKFKSRIENVGPRKPLTAPSVCLHALTQSTVPHGLQSQPNRDSNSPR
jgi:hypothetical protein